MSGSLERAILPRLDALEHAVRELRAELKRLAVSADRQAREPRATDRADKLYLGNDFNKGLHNALIEAGFDTNEKVRKASDEELRAVRGIGVATLHRIRWAMRSGQQE